jgi:hypothetical protein
MVRMSFAVILLLLAAAPRVDLVNEVIEIPGSEWRYVELNLKQQPVAVTCDFSASEGDRVRLALLRGEDLQRLRGDRPHGVLAATEAGPRAALRFAVPEPGEYVVVVDNRSGRRAKVHLRVGLDFSAHAAPQVRYLSRERQWTVVLASFAFFFGVVIYSARRLLRGARPPAE